MEFKGTRDETCDMSIKSSAIISRTNSGLIGEIIALAENDIKFSLTRKASQIFELVLILANLKPGGKIFSREWSFLQDEVDEWNMNPFLLSEYKSAFAYIADKYSEDIQIKTATKIIGKYGTRSVYSAYNAAKESEKRKTKGIVLCTAHSSKGLEFDKVKIADDLNNSLSKIFEERSIAEFTEKDIEEFRLYYVACSRAKKELINAEWL
jgi:superfamily I DNA/RNA helicase